MTEDLKQLYVSNTADIRAFDTVEMSHPNFSQVFYLINDPVGQTLMLDDDVTPADFIPFAFSISPPPKGSNQQDMQFIFDNVMQIGIDELERAAVDIDTPITIIFRTYIEGSNLMQAPAISLEMTNVSATHQTIAGTAARVNLFGRFVPARIFEPWNFKGLI